MRSHRCGESSVIADFPVDIPILTNTSLRPQSSFPMSKSIVRTSKLENNNFQLEPTATYIGYQMWQAFAAIVALIAHLTSAHGGALNYTVGDTWYPG
jgi:hypothetical protein